MSRAFDDRGPEAGMQTMQDLISHTAQELNQTIETHGADSIEAAGLGLIIATFHFVMGEYRKADPLIRNYIYVAEENYGSNSDEVLCGLILLSNNCIWWGRLEDSRSVLEQVKLISGRCSCRRVPLLQGLYDLARRCQSRNAPGDEQRAFILFLLALSWCVRYPSGHNYSQSIPEVKVAGYHEIYAQYIQLLKPVFETYGFVEERWDWLIRHCNHNLHDLVGLISIFREKDILPSDTHVRLPDEVRQERVRPLAQEFPVCKEGALRDRIPPTGGHPMKLEFMCPLCGSRNLRTMFMEPYYPISTLDGIAVDPGNVDLCDLIEREPSEYEGQGHTEGWQFWCDKCGLEPKLDQDHEEEEAQEEALARWLLDNCPQDEGLLASATSHSEG